MDNSPGTIFSSGSPFQRGLPIYPGCEIYFSFFLLAKISGEISPGPLLSPAEEYFFLPGLNQIYLGSRSIFLISKTFLFLGRRYLAEKKVNPGKVRANALEPEKLAPGEFSCKFFSKYSAIFLVNSKIFFYPGPGSSSSGHQIVFQEILFFTTWAKSSGCNFFLLMKFPARRPGSFLAGIIRTSGLGNIFPRKFRKTS